MAVGNYIYKKYDFAKECFILKEGDVSCEITETDNFTISSPNTIFGAGELIVEDELKRFETRHFAVKEGNNCKFQKVPKDNLIKLLNNQNIILNIARQICQNIKSLERIYLEKSNEINEEERLEKEYCKLYANVLNILIHHFEEMGFPWLEEVINQYKETLMFAKGKEFLKFSTEAPEKIGNERVERIDYEKYSSLSTTFVAGDTIFSEDDEPNVCYVLQEGKLQIQKGGAIIFLIDKPGTMIGEVNFFLNQKRTLKVTAAEETKLIKIEKSKNYSPEENSIYNKIICTLSHQELINCNSIEESNAMLNQGKKLQNKVTGKVMEYKQELKKLREEISSLNKKYEMDWIASLEDDLSQKMSSMT